MDMLRRQHAPLSSVSWSAIDDEAKNVLSTNLSARIVFDLSGPHGFDYSALDLGRLDKAHAGLEDGVGFAVRSVQPLLEARTAFVLSRSELDNLDRGARDVDLEPVREAAANAAKFEERTAYEGLDAAGIRGLRASSEHPPIAINDDATSILDAVSAGMVTFNESGVGGPYRLLLGSAPWRALTSEHTAYPIRLQVAKLLGAPPIHAPFLQGGLLLSTRGGDFELVLGQDYSIGFDRCDGDSVHLHLLESFTFRFPGGEAVIALRGNSPSS